ncbi:MAG: hypothetical protein RI894_1162 [Bacteroidota bacterium]|jgi:cytochrome oxidase Cu insertion factor (SCO1/SenC/PrrC family)
MNKRKIFSYIFLTIILGVIPAGSWYYLRDGLRYRKERIGALNAFGNWGKDLQIKLINGKPFNADSIRGRFVVVSVFDPADSSDKNQIAASQQLQRFQNAFGPERPDIFCLSLPTPKSDSGLIAAYAKRYKANPKVWHIAQANDQISVLYDSLHLQQNAKAKDGIHDPYFTLVDNKFKIRNYYDATKVAEVNKMVEVISIIMPPKAVPSIKYRKPEER